VGDIAQELSQFLFTDGWSMGQLDEIWAAGLLPPRFRDAYRLPFTPLRRRAHHAMRAANRRLLRRLPPWLRYVPAYHQATMRVAIARGEPVPLHCRAINAIDRRRDLPLSLEPIAEPEGGDIVATVRKLAGLA
jgi:hypothetical protein